MIPIHPRVNKLERALRLVVRSTNEPSIWRIAQEALEAGGHEIQSGDRVEFDLDDEQTLVGWALGVFDADGRWAISLDHPHLGGTSEGDWWLGWHSVMRPIS